MQSGDPLPEPVRPFEDDPAVIYVLNSDLRLIYCNAAWDTFAEENGGDHLRRNEVIGTDLLTVTPTALKGFFSTAYASVLSGGGDENLLYECSSPDVYRQFHMQIKRMEIPGSGYRLAVINSLVHESPHTRAALQCDPADLRGAGGLITMCCHCRRISKPGTDPKVWLWVPELLRAVPPTVSHGLCAVCYFMYYGRDRKLPWTSQM